MILLYLRPASLTHKNPQRRNIIHGIRHTFVFPLISLQASCQEHSGGMAGKGRRACYYISGIWISTSEKLMQNPHVVPCQKSCQTSANQCKAETSTNVNKHWKTCVKGNDIITNVISILQHFASTFSMYICKFQRRSCKLSFLFLPHHQSTLESLFPCFPLIESFDIFALEL